MKYVPKKYLSAIALLIFSFLTSPIVYANEILYIQSTRVKVLEQPNFSAASIAELSKGKKVEVINKRPNWVQIKIGDNQQGWIVAMLLAASPPLPRPSLLENLQQRDAEKKSSNARRRATVSATAAATRGLRNQTESNEIEKPNYQDLRKVESRQVSNNDAWDFHKKLQTSN